MIGGICMTEKRKIDFEVKDFDRVEMNLDDFKWLITSYIILAMLWGVFQVCILLKQQIKFLK